jgi:hypothetical protein
MYLHSTRTVQLALRTFFPIRFNTRRRSSTSLRFPTPSLTFTRTEIYINSRIQMLRQQRVQVQKFKSMLLVNALTHLGVPRILGIHFRFSYSNWNLDRLIWFNVHFKSTTR